MGQEYFEDALEIFRTLPNSYKANEQIMSILAYQNNNDELTKFYEGILNKDEYLEHYYSLINDHEKLVDLYQEKLVKTSLTKSEIIAYAFSLLKTENYDSVISLLKPYFDNPQLTDGAIIINYQYARLKRERNTADKIKTKVKEKIFDNKFIDYSNFEKFGAACVIGNKNDIISYLSKIIKANPLDKYIVRDWPILEPYLNDTKIINLLSPSEKKLEQAKER